MKQLLVAAAIALLTLAAAPVGAQEAEPAEAEASPEDRETSFRQVTGPVVEDVPGGALMIGAYGVAWLLVLAYVWRLATLSRRTAAEVDALHHALKARDEETT